MSGLYYLASLNHGDAPDTVGVDGCVLWWKPESRGYTTNLDEAGKYTEKEARSIAAGASQNVLAIPCAKVEERARRTVPVAHVPAFRVAVGKCVNFRCSNGAGDTDECPRCVEGARGPRHFANPHDPGATACGQLLAEDRSRTFHAREPVVLRLDAVTCKGCRAWISAHPVHCPCEIFESES